MSILLNLWKIKKVTAKTILRAIFSLTVCSATLASEGLYVGLGVGSSFLNGEQKSISPIKSKKVRKKGELATAFIGYNHAITDTPMFVGVELGASCHPIRKTIYGTYPTYMKDYVFSLSTNNSLHGHLRLGFTASNLSFYCKAGIAQTNFKATMSAFQKDKATSFTKYGASTGIGVEAKMNKNFSLGIDYTYAKYGSLRNIEPDPVKNLNMRYIPEIHSTSLRLIYNF